MRGTPKFVGPRKREGILKPLETIVLRSDQSASPCRTAPWYDIRCFLNAAVLLAASSALPVILSTLICRCVPLLPAAAFRSFTCLPIKRDYFSLTNFIYLFLFFNSFRRFNFISGITLK